MLIFFFWRPANPQRLLVWFSILYARWVWQNLYMLTLHSTQRTVSLTMLNCAMNCNWRHTHFVTFESSLADFSMAIHGGTTIELYCISLIHCSIILRQAAYSGCTALSSQASFYLDPISTGNHTLLFILHIHSSASLRPLCTVLYCIHTLVPQQYVFLLTCFSTNPTSCSEGDRRQLLFQYQLTACDDPYVPYCSL